MNSRFKVEFFDQYHKIGIAWEENGRRKAVSVDIPEDVALKLFKVVHPGLNRFEDD